jgi:hypothetical protein
MLIKIFEPKMTLALSMGVFGRSRRGTSIEEWLTLSQRFRGYFETLVRMITPSTREEAIFIWKRLPTY